MSFILQALKKSEKERIQGQAGAPLPAPQPPIPQKKRIPGKLRLTLLTTMAVIALVVAFWPKTEAPEQDSGEVPVTAPGTLADKGATSTLPAPQAEAQDAEHIPRLAAVTKKIVFQGYTPQEPQTTAFETAPSRTELPPSIQKQLPTWKISGHTYSQRPEQRMVVIGSRILREGEQIDPQTTLLEITWEGIVVRSGSTVFAEVLHAASPTPR